MHYMKKVLTALLLLALAPALLAQNTTTGAASTAAAAASSGDVETAKSLARSYGYTNEEIDKILTRNINGQIVSQPASAGTVAIPVTSDASVMMQDIPQPVQISPIEGRKAPSSIIYGHDFFISDGLALIPSVNAPLPESYVLGPGDRLVIDVTGDANANFVCPIANDGSITIKNVGTVYIGGKTLVEAEKLIRGRLSSAYGSIRSGGSQLHVSVSQIRGVTVYVLGEVYTPGVYTMPSLTSVATAIYMAGGIQRHGSVRDISLYRQGRLVGKFDLYAFIFEGRYDQALRLQDGDIISVASLHNIVKVGGGVNRHLRYEMLDGETVADVIRYAGGFDTEAVRSRVHLDRIDEQRGTSFDVEAADFGTFQVSSGDSLYVYLVNRDIDNRVYIDGSVIKPGPYSISDSLNDLRQLIVAAGGLREGTNTERAHLRRLDALRRSTDITFSPEKILSGEQVVGLMRDDSVRIYSVVELVDTVRVYVAGAVKNPGEYIFNKGLTLGSLLLEAGGISEGADLSHIEIASRGNDVPSSIRYVDMVSDPEAGNTEIDAYDKVSVRLLPYYRPIMTVTVEGEMKYPGVYALENSAVRLSDIVSRADGFTEHAYPKGARLRRKMSEAEKERKEVAKDIAIGQKMVLAQADSLSVADNVRLSDTLSVYSVAIDILGAVKNPGTYIDLVLQDGDIIEVPPMNNTVKISGGVYQPNTVAFNPSFSWRDYINQAGGFVKGAYKNRVYAIYMDGSSAVKGSKGFRVEPGMELVVPQRTDADMRPTSVAEISAIISSVSSMAYMAAILVSMLRNNN